MGEQNSQNLSQREWVVFEHHGVNVYCEMGVWNSNSNYLSSFKPLGQGRRSLSISNKLGKTLILLSFSKLRSSELGDESQRFLENFPLIIVQKVRIYSLNPFFDPQNLYSQVIIVQGGFCPKVYCGKKTMAAHWDHGFGLRLLGFL